jgi:hypothetical protein
MGSTPGQATSPEVWTLRREYLRWDVGVPNPSWRRASKRTVGTDDIEYSKNRITANVRCELHSGDHLGRCTHNVTTSAFVFVYFLMNMAKKGHNENKIEIL